LKKLNNYLDPKNKYLVDQDLKNYIEKLRIRPFYDDIDIVINYVD